MSERTVSSLDDESLRSMRLTFPEPADRDAWWRSLTTLTQKWSEYSKEATFRESLADTTALLGTGFEEILQQVAVVTIKPDGLAGRRADAVLAFLRENRFSVVHLLPVVYTPIQSRDLWRYQWNTASLDRLCLWDLLCTTSRSLMLVVRDHTAGPEIPAAVRLRSLKGSAVPEFRNGNTLRAAVDAPNRVLSMIHAADEPIDLIREIGIVLSAKDRLNWLGSVAENYRGPGVESDRISQALTGLSERLPRVDFRLEPSVQRLREAWATHTRRGIDEFLESAQTNRFREWVWRNQELIDDGTIWDVLTVASHVIRRDEPNQVCTIDDDGRPEWYAGLGNMRWKG